MSKLVTNIENMSDSVDALLAEEDVGDYDLRDDEEDALLEDDDTLETNKDGEYQNQEEVVDDVLELNMEDTLNEEEEHDFNCSFNSEEGNHRTKFISERTENIEVKVTPNTVVNPVIHTTQTRQNLNMNVNNHGNFRGRGAYRGNNRGRGNLRPQNIQNRNIQQKRLQGAGAKKCFLNPHFKGNIKSNSSGNKPVIPIRPWANNPPPPINNFQQPPPLIPSLPPVVIHNQPFQNMRQIPPPIQEMPPQIHQRPPVHQRLGFNQQVHHVNTYVPPCPSYHHEQRQVTVQNCVPMNQMMPPPNLHMNNPPPNNPPMVFNQQPIFNQPPPPIYQPNTYTPPQNYNYQQYNTYQTPPIHHQVPLYNQVNEHDQSYEQQQQIINYPVETNYNNQMQQPNQWDSNVADHAYVPPQSQNVMHSQGYDQSQSVQIFHKNRKFINNFPKRWNKRSDGYEDNTTFNKRRTFENKVLQEVPTVDNLTHVDLTVTVRQPEVEEDEETKKYRKQIEEQKKMRERILAEKEQRRKLAAQKKLEEEVSQKPVEPVAPNPLKSVVVNKVLANPNIKIIKPNDSVAAENKVEKERLMSFLNNRTIFAKDQSLVDTSVVVVNNLAAGTSEVKLRKLGQGVGDIQVRSKVF